MIFDRKNRFRMRVRFGKHVSDSWNFTRTPSRRSQDWLQTLEGLATLFGSVQDRVIIVYSKNMSFFQGVFIYFGLYVI